VPHFCTTFFVLRTDGACFVVPLSPRTMPGRFFRRESFMRRKTMNRTMAAIHNPPTSSNGNIISAGRAPPVENIYTNCPMRYRFCRAGATAPAFCINAVGYAWLPWTGRTGHRFDMPVRIAASAWYLGQNGLQLFSCIRRRMSRKSGHTARKSRNAEVSCGSSSGHPANIHRRSPCKRLYTPPYRACPYARIRPRTSRMLSHNQNNPGCIAACAAAFVSRFGFVSEGPWSISYRIKGIKGSASGIILII